MLKKLVFTFVSFCLLIIQAKAQNKVTTVGLQFKPIISSEIINTGPQFNQVREIGFEIAPSGGFSFGMVIRKGITEQISFETGINYTRRNYDLTITDDIIGFTGESDFRYVIYEIPITGLVNVQLGKQSFLNTSFGFAFDFLPSDWESSDTYFQHVSFRKRWVVPSLLANIGFEYRTQQKGFYYFGFSYHRPFSNITDALVAYQTPDEFGITRERERSTFEILGNYLTIDLRYFFHEDPERRSKKRK